MQMLPKTYKKEPKMLSKDTPGPSSAANQPETTKSQDLSKHVRLKHFFQTRCVFSVFEVFGMFGEIGVLGAFLYVT